MASPRVSDLEDRGILTITILGACAVGKSSITLRFVNGIFAEEYDPTIEDCFRKTVEINGKPQVFDIVDSAGQEEYRFVSQSYLQMSHGFLIVYSVNDPSSLNEAKIIYNSLKDLRDLEKVPCLLIGNKIDLETRAVSEEQGRALADIWKCGYFETSAKEFINIEEAFLTLAELVIQQKRVNDELRAQGGAPTRGLLRLCTVL